MFKYNFNDLKLQMQVYIIYMQRHRERVHLMEMLAAGRLKNNARNDDDDET